MFKLNDKVRNTVTAQDGVVTKIDDGESYPILVTYNEGGTDNYTTTGQYLEDHAPVLILVEPPSPKKSEGGPAKPSVQSEIDTNLRFIEDLKIQATSIRATLLKALFHELSSVFIAKQAAMLSSTMRDIDLLEDTNKLLEIELDEKKDRTEALAAEKSDPLAIPELEDVEADTNKGTFNPSDDIPF